jgi:hypothetical protein
VFQIPRERMGRMIVVGNTSGADDVERGVEQRRAADETTDRMPEVTCMKNENESKLASEKGFDRVAFKKAGPKRLLRTAEKIGPLLIQI